ncbi:MAG: pyruvate formate-lyase [Clostridia bacterium]|nr:pyruvate formate-lyase [Clostridia bacterium]
MTSFMENARNYLLTESNKSLRAPLDEKLIRQIEAEIQSPDLSLEMRASLRLKRFLENEQIIRMPGEHIYAWRTIETFPDIYAPGEKERLHAGHHIHEQGRVCNLSSDWENVLAEGLLRRKTGHPARDLVIDAVISYADRYEDTSLSDAVRHGAKHYLDALKALRILHFALWASNVYHNTLGRFDQYMYPFFKKDIESGFLTREDALSYTEELFLSFNRDSDLYIGMQQGDNGQSLMLGGVTRDGKDAVNELTYICLKASLNNRRIDPKINLRVNKDTPLELYLAATELTKQGLGFPQYANDDVVIPALVKLGYDIEDARDYTVAACWEFIIPGKGMDIPNITAVSLAKEIHESIVSSIETADSFECVLESVKARLKNAASACLEEVASLWMEPAPYQSVLMNDYSRDISTGAKYTNYGVHGTGFADAVDQLAAVRKYVFESKLVSAGAFTEALKTNFASERGLLKLLRTEAPKLGRDDECIPLADFLLNAFADALAPLRNEFGGIFRAGTGSAMYYLWHADELSALSNGHMPGDRLSANFSPSLLVQDAGPLTVIRHMARPALERVINGGPLTLEMHDSVMRNEEGVEKVAMLVRTFIMLGGHQLQLNAVNLETLKDARIHPENHKNLIVRVWGWSGHFVQLDAAYQDQILMRASYR